MKVLIACEFSGIVRDAFIRRGHDAVSCDLLPTERPGPHIQDDVLKHLDEGWDMMIAHPPCTYLSYAATHVWDKPGRVFDRLDGLRFFAELWESKIPRICIENPKGCASPTIAKYTQEIQPFQFGDPFFKTTWLWLRNLPPLKYSSTDTLFEHATAVAAPSPIRINEGMKARHHTETISGGHERSRFWPGIAEAMATQWSCVLDK